MAADDLRELLNEVGGWDGFEVRAIRREDALTSGCAVAASLAIDRRHSLRCVLRQLCQLRKHG